MEASGEWFIALPPEFLATHPGSYTLRLEGGAGDPTTLYTITVGALRGKRRGKGRREATDSLMSVPGGCVGRVRPRVMGP
jgi:hypothetical protein